MGQAPQIAHGFYLTEAEEDGSPSIFRKALFPDQIIAIKPADHGGSEVTYTMTNGQPLTLTFTQGIKAVHALCDRCRQLDAEMEAGD